jgi:DNA-directed RNA polymerase specialized sigma24 family protein
MDKGKEGRIIQHSELITLTNKVVSRYVYKGAIPRRDSEDVAMSIVEKFLTAEKKINESFKGNSKTTTYCIAILNRMCCEIIRKDFKRWKEVSELEPTNERIETTHSYEAEKQTIINSEIARFKQIIEFTDHEQHKLLLYLKFIYNTNITEEDVQNYAQENADNVFGQLYETKDESLGTKYNILATFTNKLENTSVSGDAIRMWLNKHTNTILNRLNQNGASRYDKEAIGLLLELL